jgi:hypothetical protein
MNFEVNGDIFGDWRWKTMGVFYKSDDVHE